PPSCGEIPLRNPHGRTMAGGLELLERVLCLVEHRLSFVEPTLLEQRAAEHQLRVADLVEEVLAAVQQRQCVTCVLFSDLEGPVAELDLRERRDCTRGL